MNMEILREVIKDLENLTAHLKTLFDDAGASDAGCKETALNNNKESVKKVSLEDVRAVLAKLSQHGKTAEVKALIVKFGANRLSELDESKYAELLEEAKGMTSD